MGAKLRVAIAGASGIGRHHAKWHHAADADVVAFLGTEASRCEQTAARLRQLFPFCGRAYTDWRELLAAEQPDIVDICAPNPVHYGLAMEALAAGCHVLCEKPLVWQPEASGAVQLARAAAVVGEAERREVLLGVCTQYSVALQHYRQLPGAPAGAGRQITSFTAEMDTLSRGRQRPPSQLWVDMGPHPLSLILAWLPEAELVPSTIDARFAANEVMVRFSMRTGTASCQCTTVVRDRDTGPLARRFGVNGFVADCEGRPDSQGIYRTVLRHGDAECTGTDLMARLIADFHQACRAGRPPAVPGALAQRNLELQVQVMQHAGVLD